MKRRSFLTAAGALVVPFRWPLSAAAQAVSLPGSLARQPMVDGWVRVGTDGRVTVFTGKAELGQGIKTALLQLAAEELVVAPERIALVMADTERTADERYTAGSHSMQDSGTAIRHAAAQARGILLGLAATRLALPVAQLSVDNGVVHGGGRSVRYEELLGKDAKKEGVKNEERKKSDALHVKASPQVSLRDPATHTVVGKPLPRIDIPAKLSGGAAYVQDIRLDGMVHGRVVRPPSPGAGLIQFDVSQVERMPGVLKVVRDGRFLAVIAQREYQAIVAMRALEKAAQWSEHPTLEGLQQVFDAVRRSPSQDFVIRDQGRVPAAAAGVGTRGVSATYRRPYVLHGSIGPSCAVAHLVDGKTTVWTHSQGVFPLRKALAEMLGVPEARVHCIHVEGSGCYGHNGADDVAADAALLARAWPGKPVRVQWMREDEHAWEPFGPPMIASARATLDATGGIASWNYDVWSSTHSSRPGGAGDLLAATHLAKPFAPTPPKPLPQPEGGGDRNAIPLYALPQVRVVHHFLPQTPLRVSALRSLGAYLNVFSIESFMDELARAAHIDPVVFRIGHMPDARAQEVIRLAADRFGWARFKRSPMRGRGFAFARYKNLAAYAAIACEVEVRRDSGELRVLRVVAAVDSGEVVNPDGIRNQMEGGIVQSLSWTTMEAVSFDYWRITSLDWGAYPILRFPQMPEQIDVHIIDRPGQPFLGTGEAAQGPAAAAIANAVADATGVRIRDLPLSRSRLRAAVGP
jgi:nicotinate dehydrogenase subunit B